MTNVEITERGKLALVRNSCQIMPSIHLAGEILRGSY